MDKQKQMIEEMAKIMAGIAGLSAYEKAEYLINAGYRKIPEGAVVLTSEEYEKHKGFSREEVDEISETAIKNSRKETAEKIFNKLYTWLDLEEIEKYGFVNIQKFDFLRKFREICKEITEGEKEISNETV